jgi:hypothetical protein
MTDLPLFLFGLGITVLVAIGVVLAVLEFNQAHTPKGRFQDSQPVSDQ